MFALSLPSYIDSSTRSRTDSNKDEKDQAFTDAAVSNHKQERPSQHVDRTGRVVDYTHNDGCVEQGKSLGLPSVDLHSLVLMTDRCRVTYLPVGIDDA